MSLVPESLRYTKDHEWVKSEGETARVGITDHAQHELTDIVFVELPKIGKKVKQGEVLGVVESVKTVADVYSPVSGVVTEANSDLNDNPQLLNESPYEKGWFALIGMEDPSEVARLMDATAYKKMMNE
ncbi:MAG: glycine cleavage system protein GcvH [Methanomassiliicoccales archaeon]|jgi:glycine cleavage system H protein